MMNELLNHVSISVILKYREINVVSIFILKIYWNFFVKCWDILIFYFPSSNLFWFPALGKKMNLFT